MYSKQISVFVENKAGRLSQIMNFLKDNNVNLRALSLADTTDFGVLRIIADDPERVAEILKKGGMTANMSHVITVKLSDEPGSLADVLAVLADNNIGVEYTYAFISKKEDEACVVMRTSDDVTAEKLLTEAGYTD